MRPQKHFLGTLLLAGILLLTACQPNADIPAAPEPASAQAAPPASQEAAPPPVVYTLSAPEITVTPPVLPASGEASPPPSQTPVITPASTEPGTIASPTPSAPPIVQLTSGGCCVQPFFSPDGAQVLFLDKPAPDAPSGFWGVFISGGEPVFWTDRLGIYARDGSLRAFPEAGNTIVERLADGQRWRIQSYGRPVSFSPDNQWVAWTTGNAGPPFGANLRNVWVSRVDGTEAHKVVDLINGGFSGWLPGGRILISGSLGSGDEDQAFWAYTLADGSSFEVARGPRLRNGTLSPGSSWLAYTVTFSGDPAQDGLWLANVASGERYRSDLFGSFRWRDDAHLLVVPLDLEVLQTTGSHVLFQITAADGVTVPLTDPQHSPFKIANGDWTVSPDGSKLAFVSAADNNIWLMELEP